MVSNATKGMSMLKNVAKNRQFGAAVSKNSKTHGLWKKPMNDDLVGASQFYRKKDVAAVRAANFGPKKPREASKLPLAEYNPATKYGNYQQNTEHRSTIPSSSVGQSAWSQHKNSQKRGDMGSRPYHIVFHPLLRKK